LHPEDPAYTIVFKYQEYNPHFSIHIKNRVRLPFLKAMAISNLTGSDPNQSHIRQKHLHALIAN
jgi:hypothetical protein